MTRAIFIVPLQYGEPQFPGVTYLFGDKPDVITPGYGHTVGCQTPAKTDPQFVTVWVNTSQANIDVLKARAECVWLTDLDDDGAWVSTAVSPTKASQMAVKVRDGLKYNAPKYAQAITAIQAARSSKDAATAVATKIYSMTPDQIAGTFGSHPPKDGKEPGDVIKAEIASTEPSYSANVETGGDSGVSAAQEAYLLRPMGGTEPGTEWDSCQRNDWNPAEPCWGEVKVVDEVGPDYTFVYACEGHAEQILETGPYRPKSVSPSVPSDSAAKSVAKRGRRKPHVVTSTELLERQARTRKRRLPAGG